MTQPQTRRTFLRNTALSTSFLSMAALESQGQEGGWFKISLAQWSLHKTFFSKKADPLNFARIAKNDYGITAVEYVNQFYMGKGRDQLYLNELKKRSENEGVKNLLIMVDDEGELGHAQEKQRVRAVENHQKWVEAAKLIGCHSIRVNAYSSGTPEDQHNRCVDGLRRLTEFAQPYGLNVIVENHGGQSSNAEWLAKVIKAVNLPTCGTLPDFGNWDLSGGKQYDRYRGVTELMPFAKGVSAKTHAFDSAGNETRTDFERMLKIVKTAGYRGYIGIEFEGETIPESDGIKLTKKLLEKVGPKV